MGEFIIDSQGLAIVIFLRKISFLQRIHKCYMSNFRSLPMRPCVIKVENAWLVSYKLSQSIRQFKAE